MAGDMVVIDADGHARDNDEIYARYLEPPYNTRAVIYPRDQWDRRQGETLGKLHVDSPGQLAALEEEGIDLQVLYPTGGLRIGEISDKRYAAALCRAYNSWLHVFCAADPRRLRGVALIPVQDPPQAVTELRRAVLELGMVGAMFPTWIPGHNVADEIFDPIYAEAESLGVPVSMHATGGETSAIGRFSHFLGVHAHSHAPEQMIAVTSIVLGGVLEKFPRLRVGFLEAGCGWVPYWMEHLDEEWEKRKFDAPLLRDEPSATIRNGRCFFACEPEEKTIPYVTQWIGEDVLLYASDFPHWDSGFPFTVRTLRERADLSDELKRKILGANALSYYGFTV